MRTLSFAFLAAFIAAPAFAQDEPAMPADEPGPVVIHCDQDGSCPDGMKCSGDDKNVCMPSN